MAGPTDHRGDAQSAFQKLRFPAGERPGIGVTLAAIVAGKDDDRVLRHAGRVERLQYAADLQIHLLDHALIGPLGTAIPMRQALEALRLGLVSRRFPGPVRGVEVQTDEKGHSGFGVGVDHIDRAVAQQIGQIAVLVDLGIVIPEILGFGRGRPVFVGVIVECAAAEAIEVIVPGLQWPEIRQPAQMPLADQGRLVADLLQDRRQGRVLRRQTDLRRAGGQGLFQPNRQPGLVTPVSALREKM